MNGTTTETESKKERAKVRPGKLEFVALLQKAHDALPEGNLKSEIFLALTKQSGAKVVFIDPKTISPEARRIWA